MAKPRFDPNKVRHDHGELPSQTSASLRMGKPSVFARNLRILTALEGLKATTACREIQQMLELQAQSQLRAASDKDRTAIEASCREIKRLPINPTGYRRLMQRGVSRSSKTTRLHMHAIALYFGVYYAELWDEELPDRLNIQAQRNSPPKDEFLIPTRQLQELLSKGAGQYDYLVELLASLHGEWSAGRRKKKK